MRPNHPIRSRAQRPSVDEVLDQARRAVATARAQRDQLQTTVRDLETDNEALRRQVRQEREALHALQARLEKEASRAPAADEVRSKRLEADLDNVRRHTATEVERAKRDTLMRAVEPLADVLDHLGRALATHPDPDNPWFKGTVAILARTKASLAGLGVQTIGSVGDAFDPAVHEAVGTLHTANVPDGSVVDVLKTGLRLTEGPVIRPAHVIVAEGGA